MINKLMSRTLSQLRTSVLTRTLLKEQIHKSQSGRYIKTLETQSQMGKRFQHTLH